VPYRSNFLTVVHSFLHATVIRIASIIIDGGAVGLQRRRDRTA